MTFVIRLGGLAMLVLWTLVVLGDLAIMSYGEYEATALAALSHSALLCGYDIWMGYALWLWPGVVGAACLFAPRHGRLRLLRPPA